MTRRILACVALLGWLVGASDARQQQPSPQQQPQTFRAGVSAVTLDVSVTRGGRLVPDLRPNDFVVFDNGVRQRVESLSIGEVPIDVSFFLGTINQSRAVELGDLHGQLRKVMEQLRDNDRVRLLTLQNAVVESFGWRSKSEAIAAPAVRVGGIQTLYDALFTAMMHTPSPGRRHLIIALSDGLEFGSIVDSKAIERAAAHADATLFLALTEQEPPPIAASAVKPIPVIPGAPAPTRTSTLAPPGTPEGSVAYRSTWLHVLADAEGMKRLFDSTETTGGAVIDVNRGASLVDVFQDVFAGFQQRYVLRYTTTGVPASGWHDLRVEIADGRRADVRARRGYFGG